MCFKSLRRLIKWAHSKMVADEVRDQQDQKGTVFIYKPVFSDPQKVLQLFDETSQEDCRENPTEGKTPSMNQERTVFHYRVKETSSLSKLDTECYPFW